MLRRLFFLALVVCVSFAAGGQKPNTTYIAHANAYIAQYKALAIAEQQRSGVPAAITLAQGIFETEAGMSELAIQANNHFGIKCRKEWTGETFAHDDDAPQECFRKYSKASDSYKDHSDYLRNNKRYCTCFVKSNTDYAAWATELRKCGYATSPTYATQLIKIIEDFHLQAYTYAAMEGGNHDSAPLMASVQSPAEAVLMQDAAVAAATEDTDSAETPVYGEAVRRKGIKGFYARKGDVLLEYAIKYNVRYAKLLELNALPDAPLGADQFVYLEKGGRTTIVKSSVNDARPTVANATPAASTDDRIPVMHATPAPVAEKPVITDQTAPITAAPVTPAIQEQPQAKNDQQAPAPIVVAALAPAAKESKSVAVNIANEPAIEEQKPVAAPKVEAPQDDFSRLKAKLDRVVYAQNTPAKALQPKATPATTITPEKQAAVASAADTSQLPATHTVLAGETAFAIARQYNITVRQLMDWNNLTGFQKIQTGQKLRVR